MCALGSETTRRTPHPRASKTPPPVQSLLPTTPYTSGVQTRPRFPIKDIIYHFSARVRKSL